MEPLRYYIAHNSGLQVLSGNGAGLHAAGEFFAGRTVEHLEGYRDRPEIVFAAVAFDGGYRTVDAGKTWQKVLHGDVRTFAIDPHDRDIVYAGAGPIRLYRSTDAGATWEPVDSMLDFPESVTAKWGPPAVFRGKFEAHVRDIFIHPDDRNLIFVLLEHGGVLLSRDRGATWSDRSAGIDYVDMHVIENVPGSTERYCVSSAQGFYRTDDCGMHWRRSEEGMPWAGTPVYCYSHEWRIVPGARPRIVLCGGRGSPGVWVTEKVNPHGHILLSDDDGAHWRFAAHGLSHEEPCMPWVLATHPSESRTLFCGMGDGGRGFGLLPNERGRGAFLVSRDAGDSWEPLLADTPAVTTAWVAAE
jgi:hypothetical protein